MGGCHRAEGEAIVRAKNCPARERTSRDQCIGLLIPHMFEIPAVTLSVAKHDRFKSERLHRGDIACQPLPGIVIDMRNVEICRRLARSTKIVDNCRNALGVVVANERRVAFDERIEVDNGNALPKFFEDARLGARPRGAMIAPAAFNDNSVFTASASRSGKPWDEITIGQ
ncbi:hypothetical protein AJ87_40345 [Rhizobium yanglingense]|nr:hypothetical protein AJ87_40345 [Rhizobium yanglingense]